MSDRIRLTDLKKGQKAIICDLSAMDDMRRRMQDIGLIEGTVVECVGKSPLGDPAAYSIRGAVIALRSEDSAGVSAILAEQQEERRTASWFSFPRVKRRKNTPDPSKLCSMETGTQEEQPWV